MDSWGKRLARGLGQGLKWGLVAGGLAVVVYWLKFAPIPVLTHAVTGGDIIAEVVGTGTLEAQRQATISSRIAGRITAVMVDQGSLVTHRQILVRLDDSELRQQVGIAEATVTAAQAAVERAVADKARVVAVLAQARREYQRSQALLERQVTPQSTFDKAIETLHVAEANVTHATAAITEAQKQLLAAEKTLAYHRARLDDTVITAPFDGLIVRRQRDPGDVVVPGSAILFHIAPQAMWVSAWIDETRLAQVHPDQPARVVFRSEPERFYPGKVARLGRETDRETREFLVDVTVETLPEQWTVGQRAEVYIQVARQAAVPLLPAHLLLWRENSPGVFVNTNAVAEWRPLHLGLRSQDAVEIVAGLMLGEQVVTPVTPQTQLIPGQRLKFP